MTAPGHLALAPAPALADPPARPTLVARPGPRSREPLAHVAALAAIAALVPARGTWSAAVVVLALLLTVPGLILLRALHVPGAAIRAFPVYVPCASLVMLLACGLAVDLAGPPMGVAAPLRTGPLLVALEVACAVGIVAGLRAPTAAALPLDRLRPRLRALWPLLLPLAAAIGALELNSGHPRGVAVAALAAVAATLVTTALRAPRLRVSSLATILFATALASMWSFSLRGHFVFGFDISAEFHVVTSTYADGRWRASHAHDAYRAMLSLTVMPALLHAVSGVSMLTLLKAVFPALFALFPVGVFLLATRFAARRWAFVAAAFLITQPYLSQQLPGVARQEIGLLLFVALVAAMLERGMPRRAQLTLVAVLAMGVVVSHYSSAYLGLMMLGGGLLLALLAWAARRAPRPSASLVVGVTVLALSAAGWYGPVTHSTSNVDTFGASLMSHGFDLLPNRGGANPISGYLFGNAPTTLAAADYERVEAALYARRRPFIDPLHVAGGARFALHDATVPEAPVRAAPLLSGLRLGGLAVNQVVNLLAALGAVAILLRRGRSRTRLVACLGLAALGILGLLRLSGTAAEAYNQERAFVQTMIPLAVVLAVLLHAVAVRRTRLAPWLGAASALALGVAFVSNSGLRPVLFGGPAGVNVARSGEDFERFGVSAPELASAQWLATVRPRPFLYADRYGQLRILAATGRSEGLFGDVTPRTLDRHAWIYASAVNVAGRSRATVGSSYVVFGWPRAYLDHYYATVYSNGASKVLHR